MSLPFLKPKNVSGYIMTTKVREPDNEQKPNDSDGSVDPGLLAAAKDLITAVGTGDEKLVAQALQAAFEICDSQPHDEGEHLNEPEQDIE